MFEQIIQWMGTADRALLGQGPIVTILLCLSAGYAAGQFWKFPVHYWCDDRLPAPLVNWSIRCCAIGTSFFLGLWLGGLEPAFIAIIALLQPTMYKLVMALMRRYVPWLAATPVGSATPTEDDEYALTQWKERKGGGS